MNPPGPATHKNYLEYPEKWALTIDGRKIGVNLEDAFWHALGDIAVAKGTTRPRLINAINQTLSSANLSSVIRVCILAYYQGLHA